MRLFSGSSTGTTSVLSYGATIKKEKKYVKKKKNKTSSEVEYLPKKIIRCARVPETWRSAASPC